MSEDGPRLTQVNLVVTDMAATVGFYRRLGVAVPDLDPEWALHHRNAEMDGGADLDFDSEAFAQVWDRGRKEGSRSVVLGFSLATREAVDETYGDLTGAGYVGEQPPYDAPWGVRFAIVLDPDGNPVGLMSPRDPSRQSEIDPPGVPAT